MTQKALGQARVFNTNKRAPFLCVSEIQLVAADGSVTPPPPRRDGSVTPPPPAAASRSAWQVDEEDCDSRPAPMLGPDQERERGGGGH